MDLLTYINDTRRRQELASILGKSPAYLWQIASNWQGRRPSPLLAIQIEEETTRMGPEAVPVQLTRPDLEWLRDAEGQVVGHMVRRSHG